ncbi:unnamed protein product [Onchocerca ochengi]|uniref:C2H2-type domain-containing protein n=1 Tax=Onchocerca ochengi TaxID=42157 RepID=A0A182EC89_ONCOC|nr:unnamed protein product [Onchocerca ochengi]
MDDDDDDDDDETMTTPSKQNISHFLPSQLAANRSSSLTMNLSATILDNVIPTAAREEALVVDPDVASTSTQMMPKKGILKRSSSHGNFPRKNAIERNLAGQFFESKQSPERFSDRPNTKIPKLTLTWSEKNAAVPDDARAMAMSFWDRIAARINLIRNVLPVLPGASKKISNSLIENLHALIIKCFFAQMLAWEYFAARMTKDQPCCNFVRDAILNRTKWQQIDSVMAFQLIENFYSTFMCGLYAFNSEGDYRRTDRLSTSMSPFRIRILANVPLSSADHFPSVMYGEFGFSGPQGPYHIFCHNVTISAPNDVIWKCELYFLILDKKRFDSAVNPGSKVFNDSEVTIYGDTTSDDGNTETDDINVPVIGSVSNGQHLPSQRSVVRLNELPKIATKIPFTVHRVQNNSKLERQTSILDNDDENEDEEVLHDDDDELAEFDNNNHAKLESNAAIGNSHIAGKWWFGKSTKNIPHCAKWGCTHDHRDKESTDNGGKYLTPTQQRFKEIHQLRKQLKLALSQLEDKDLHLNELREQLRDLESVVGSANIISEKHQHLLHKESNEDYEREKKKLIDKHEIRVRQLIKEAVDARAEMMQVKIAMKQLEEAKVKTEVKDAEMMTEMVEEISPSEIHPEPSRLSSSFSPSSQTGNAAEARIGQIPQELSLQLQAYENEAMAWRMKAAQLEMVLKDYISKKQQDIFNPELEKYRNDNERLRTYIKNIEANMSNHAMIDSGFQTCLNVLLETSADCCSQQCEERRKQLREENNHLLEKIEEQTLRLNEHDENIKLLRQTIHSMNEENKKSLHTMKQMSKEIEERTAEVEVANITALQLQSELGIKTKAICYLEERHQVYRNTILDHDLVVKDESTDDWERGFSDPRYVVNVSKRVQTDLTVEILRENELKFIEITEKLEALIKEFSAKENKMLEHFREIEKDLSAKNSLVGSLANQLEKADQEAKKSSELQQKEREAFQKKLYELGQVAENIPVLQFEIEKLQQVLMFQFSTSEIDLVFN